MSAVVTAIVDASATCHSAIVAMRYSAILCHCRHGALVATVHSLHCRHALLCHYSAIAAIVGSHASFLPSSSALSQ